ncbi:MAG: CmpA/NrtA family ABC transporter substrate-binding protein [Pseudomonadota bacterium]
MNLTKQPELQLGYLRLTDSAPALIARALGFFSSAGLSVTLRQEVSWANLRDKLTVGELQAANLLVPLPALVRLGASGIRTPLLTGLILSANGNAITVRPPLAQPADDLREPYGALSAAQRPLTFATVHHFSTHMVLLRRWLRGAGLDPDRDVRTLIIPPSQMVDALAAGLIDGFCAGEPWNSLAAQQGVGTIAAYGQDIWPNAPEKALCVREDWHEAHPETHLRLRQALMRACRWLQDPGNRHEAVHLLAGTEALNLPEAVLAPALLATTEHKGAPAGSGLYHFEDGQAAAAWYEQAHALVEACTELLSAGPDAAAMQQILGATYRADLYTAARESLTF